LTDAGIRLKQLEASLARPLADTGADHDHVGVGQYAPDVLPVDATA
jgi:hypothetical protein